MASTEMSAEKAIEEMRNVSLNMYMGLVAIMFGKEGNL